MMPGDLVGIQCSGSEEDAVKAFLGRLDTPGTATGEKNRNVVLCLKTGRHDFASWIMDNGSLRELVPVVRLPLVRVS